MKKTLVDGVWKKIKVKKTEPTPKNARKNKYRHLINKTTSKKRVSLLRVKKRLADMIDESYTLKKIAVTIKYHNLIPKPKRNE